MNEYAVLPHQRVELIAGEVDRPLDIEWAIRDLLTHQIITRGLTFRTHFIFSEHDPRRGRHEFEYGDGVVSISAEDLKVDIPSGRRTVLDIKGVGDGNTLEVAMISASTNLRYNLHRRGLLLGANTYEFIIKPHEVERGILENSLPELSERGQQKKPLIVGVRIHLQAQVAYYWD